MTTYTETPAVTELRTQLAAPERIEPGTEGWWQVYGATPDHVRAGDVLVMLDPDGELTYDEVATATVRSVDVRYTDPAGAVFRLGRMFRGFTLFRRGTHHTLAR
jgi:hypothetical protein